MKRGEVSLYQNTLSVCSICLSVDCLIDIYSTSMGSNEMPEGYKLAGLSNYQTWKYRAKLMMMRDNVWRYVDPMVRPLNNPVAGEPEDVALSRIKALSIIGLNCKEEVYQGIKDVIDPREAWNRLTTAFQSTTNAS